MSNVEGHRSIPRVIQDEDRQQKACRDPEQTGSQHIDVPWIEVWVRMHGPSRKQLPLHRDRTLVGNGGATYYIFGECGMRNRLTGFHELDELIARTGLTRAEVDPTCMLFSTSGFDNDLLDCADVDAGVKLVTLDRIMGRAPAEPL